MNAQTKTSEHICERCGSTFQYSGNVKRCPTCRTSCEQCGVPTNYNRLCEQCRQPFRKAERLTECLHDGCATLVRKDKARSGYCLLHYDKSNHATRIAEYNRVAKSKPSHLHHKSQNNYVVDLTCKVCHRPFKGRLGTVKYGTSSDGYCCSPRCVGIIAAKKTPKSLTSIEQAIAKALDQRQLHYLQQVPLCGITLADFFLPEYNIVLYCDGEYWHRSPKRQTQDALQNQTLQANGYRVYRFTEQEIQRSPDGCLECLNLSEESPFLQPCLPTAL